MYAQTLASFGRDQVARITVYREMGSTLTADGSNSRLIEKVLHIRVLYSQKRKKLQLTNVSHTARLCVGWARVCKIRERPIAWRTLNYSSHRERVIIARREGSHIERVGSRVSAEFVSFCYWGDDSHSVAQDHSVRGCERVPRQLDDVRIDIECHDSSRRRYGCGDGLEAMSYASYEL